MIIDSIQSKSQRLCDVSHKTCVTAFSLLLLSTSVFAFKTQVSGVDLSFDTTLSYGSSWRLEERKASNVGKCNNFTTQGLECPDDIAVQVGLNSANSDNGNLNYDKNDRFSQAIKAVHELELRYQDYGAFVRGTYFYDTAIMDKDLRYQQLTDEAKGQHGKDGEILDAFVFGNTEILGQPTEFRLGRQVISWGESIFLQHGLNFANPVDVPKLRVPGAEVRDAFRPIGTLWIGQGLTDTWAMELYYQYEWEPSIIDAPGTYFSTNDFVGPGPGFVDLGFGRGIEGASSAPVLDPRLAKDDGQFGVKFNWFSDILNDAEFGFYFANYHNRRPIITGNTITLYNGQPTGFLEYPENVQVLGLSFNSYLPLTQGSIAGEIAYRIDEPLQVDDVELLFALTENAYHLSDSAAAPGTSQVANPTAIDGEGEEVSGYRLLDNVQLEFNHTNIFGQVLGSEQMVLLVEAGMNYIIDMPEQDELRFEAPGTGLSGNPARAELEGMTENQFASNFSWGYILVTKLDYLNAYKGLNISPRVVFKHDVNGTTPAPINNFVEDRMSLALGVGFSYQKSWTADIAVQLFNGGGQTNSLIDRDFVSINFKYSI